MTIWEKVCKIIKKLIMKLYVIQKSEKKLKNNATEMKDFKWKFLYPSNTVLLSL